MQKLLLCLGLVLFFANAFAAKSPPPRFGLNDVSILLPLPKDENEASHMLATHHGAQGQEILPRKYLDLLDPLILDDEDQLARWDQLRVIGIRFDPCFIEAEGPAPCRRQIRLVFQPLSNYSYRPVVFDASIHAFYEFSEKEWQSVLTEWQKTLVDSPENPLQVHPQIKAEGLAGPHWRRLKGLVQRFCRPQTLVRVTESSVTRFGLQWHFMGFDILPNGKAQSMIIPRIQKPKQQFSNGLGNLREFDSEIYPSPEEKNWAKFLNDSARAKNQMTEEELLKVVQRAFEFENPQRFNTANLDCASCHIAQTVRLWGENNIKNLHNNPDIARVRFMSSWNLEFKYKMPLFSNRVRAFGYFTDEVNISPRVINETAVAADLLAGSLR